MKGLIITADDFGAAREINEAVEQAHRHGVLTAASLMTVGLAAADAVARARATPSLRVGLHIVLVEGRPIMPPAEIPDLVDAAGSFRNDMALAGLEMFCRPSVRRQLAAEVAAQFEAFRATGLVLDHVNAHKHFHLHPTVASTILKIGHRYGIRAMRVPLEPRAVLAATEPRAKLAPAYLTAPFARVLRRRLRAHRLCAPDAVFGLRWSGQMNAKRLRGLIAHLPDGLSEIYLHPASRDAFEGAVPGYRYQEEFLALIDPAVVAEARTARIWLGGFLDFCAQS